MENKIKMTKTNVNVENPFAKYEGKVVATRGYSSGVNVGRFVSIDQASRIITLTNAYFLRSWEYKKSHGSMASLSSGDITGGNITRVHEDSIILDASHMVVCPDSVLDICEKHAK